VETTDLAELNQWLGLHQPGINPAERVEAFKAAWSETKTKSARGDFPKPFAGKHASLQTRRQTPAQAQYAQAQAIVDLEKSVGPDQLASLQDVIARAKVQQADLQKDWTFTNPSPLPLPYDLLPVVQILVNRKTPLYDLIPQGPASGVAHHYFQVKGWSNSGQGGIPNLLAGIDSDTVQTPVGTINLRRGVPIQYATASSSVQMIEHGMYDSVGYGARFAMQGLVDAQELSHTALLWASLGAAEREHLYGRGTAANGFQGVLAAPTGVSVAAAAATGSQVGNTANIPTLYVYVTANSGPGQSVASTIVATTALSATTGDVINVSFTLPSGALGATVYAGTTTGIANAFYAGTTNQGGADAFTIQFTGGGTGGTPNSGAQPSATDSSASTYSYDGLLTAATGTNSGYVKSLDGPLSTSTPGGDIQTALAALYGQGSTNNFADPDHIWTTASIRAALSVQLQTLSSTNYRFTAQISDGGVVMGGLVTGIQNQSNGRDNVPLDVHPYMPTGCMLIQSFHLPMPDSRVANPVEFRQVQPFMSIDWTDIDLASAASTYWFGSLVHYAPQFSGAIINIKD